MSTRPGWVNAVLTGAVYFAVGQAARLAISPGYATAVWPAAGVALIATARWGWPALLGVLAGAFAVNVNNGPPVLALALALGPTLQAWVGARLVREPLRPAVFLDRGRDVARFLLLGGPVSCVVAATWAHAVLFASGSLAGSDLAFSWFTWWIGDAIGVIVVAPVLLVLFGEPRPLWRGRIITVALPMLVACAAVAFVFVLSSRSASARLQAELSTRAAVIAHAIEQRLDRYTDVVAATASFVTANPQLTRDQFATFATGAFGRDTDIKTLGWCPRVTPDERAAIEAAGRALDPSFAFRVITPSGLAPAPEHATMFPLLYSEPPSSRLGVDMSSEETRASAIALAEVTDKPAATRPLVLLRGLRGFLVVAPVYAGRGSRRLAGVTVGGYSTAALIASATAGLDTDGLWITITDVTGPDPVPLDGVSLEATDWSHDLVGTGRVWRIGVARIAPIARSWDSWYVLAAGLAFVGVLGGVLLAITGARARIAATEARYRDLYENAPDLYVSISIGSGKIVECNAAAGRELGYERDELIGLSLFDMAAPDDRELLVRSVAALGETGSLALPHVVLRRKHGGQFDASISATAIAAGTELLAARVLVRDISDIVESERDHQFQVELGELLRASESIEALMARAAVRISDYLGLAKCHFCQIDAEAGQVLVHQYTRGEHESKEVATVASYEAVGLGPLLRGKHHVVDDVATEPAFASAYEQAFAPRGLRAFIAIPLMRAGVCCAYFGVVSDQVRAWTPREVALVQSTAERAWLWSEHLRSLHDLRELSRDLEKRVDERTRDLVAAVNEKDVLLKEIHHRVKNNLQVISSMLNLQARQLRDPVLAAAFAESQQRIQTIALVHERLYPSRDLSNIGLDDYLRSLVDNVMYAQNAAERGIAARTEIAGISLPIQRAIPCGLIVNELITNAVKHAFPAGRPGTSRVSMKQAAEQIELIVADDGVGLPAGRDPKKPDSLGLDLVLAFAEQLDATLDIRNEGGAAFTLRFSAS